MAACHQQKQPRPSSGSTTPIGPLASIASPQAAPTPAAPPRVRCTGPSRQPTPPAPATRAERMKSHRASVVQNTSGASGVAARPPTPVERHVAIARPHHGPTAGRKIAPPMCMVSRQVPTVSNAEASRAPVSLTPAVAKPARCSQFTSTGFSTRSRPLKVGTTQSPVRCIASEQAALRGSSSSQRGGPPRFGRSTRAAATATASPEDREIGMASGPGRGGGAAAERARPEAAESGRESRGRARRGSSREGDRGKPRFSRNPGRLTDLRGQVCSSNDAGPMDGRGVCPQAAGGTFLGR